MFQFFISTIMIKKMLVAAVVAIAPTLMFAQYTPYFGVRLSFDVTHPAGANEGINNGSGFSLTGIYNLPIGQHAYFEPGVGIFYNTMGIKPFEMKDALFDGSVRNFGFRVPLNIGYRFEMFDNFELAGFTGPWFNINCSTKAHLESANDFPIEITSPSMFDYGWHRFDAQWGFGISATYNKQYYLSISGGVGMSAMATFTADGHKDRLRRNTVSITVGYNF